MNSHKRTRKMTISKSPIQIYYITPGTVYRRYLIPNMDNSNFPWLANDRFIVNGIYGYECFNQSDFYDDSPCNIQLLTSYKIDVFYNDNQFHYEPADPYQKFEDCYNFIVSCIKHYKTVKAIDELE